MPKSGGGKGDIETKLVRDQDGKMWRFVPRGTSWDDEIGAVYYPDISSGANKLRI